MGNSNNKPQNLERRLPAMPFAYFYHEDILKHKGSTSAYENPERLSKITETINECNYPVFDGSDVTEKMLLSLVRRVHSEEYLDSLDALIRVIKADDSTWGCSNCGHININNATRCYTCYQSPPGNKWLYIDESNTSYFNAHTMISSLRAARCSVDLAIKLANYELKKGFAIVRPPGHHAGQIVSGGYCVLNNVAIAAEAALSQGVGRIFILDWDPRHGNGIQDHFYHRKDVFYASIHVKGAYPGTGKINETGVGEGLGYNLNIPLKSGTSSEKYLKVFVERVIPALVEYNPDLILIAAGFDDSENIGLFRLTVDTYAAMLTQILVSFRGGVPIGMILEGGYSSDYVSKCIECCSRTLSNSIEPYEIDE